jgi:hypothetical protein
MFKIINPYIRPSMYKYKTSNEDQYHLFSLLSIYTSSHGSLNIGDTHSRFVVLCIDGEGVPISFLIGNDGLAIINSLRLSQSFG